MDILNGANDIRCSTGYWEAFLDDTCIDVVFDRAKGDHATYMQVFRPVR